jgi:hypothetical protein
MRLQVRQEGERHRERHFAVVEQTIFRRDQRAERLFRHAAPEQDRHRVDVTRAADPHVRRNRGDHQPGVVIDKDATAVHRDFLAAVPRAQHRQSLGVECVVGYLSSYVEDCIAGVELSHHAGVQIAAYQFMGSTENHPHTPPVSSSLTAGKVPVTPETLSCAVPTFIDLDFAQKVPCIQAIYDDQIAACDERFQRNAAFGAPVTHLRNT